MYCSRNDVGDGLLVALPSLVQLEVLLLPYTNVSSAGGRVFGSLPSLSVLKLTSCPNFSDHGLRDLSESASACRGIKSLDVGGGGITNECVPYLSRFSSLESLQLWETRVNSTAAGMIAQTLRLAIDDQIRCTAGTWIFVWRKGAPE
jgi:hypothetical protein